MQFYNVQWETESRKAGGMGRVEAESVEDAKARTRVILADTTQLTQDEIDNVIITVEEEA